MKRKIGAICMGVGVVLVLAALSLFLWNWHEARQAENAAEQVVNLADFIENGQRIYFPTEEEVQEQPERWQDPETETNGQTMEAGVVNINTAGKEELMSLSGIGEAKAENIITYRETQGAFEKTEDIMNVNGIGENLFQKIKNDICVGR